MRLKVKKVLSEKRKLNENLGTNEIESLTTWFSTISKLTDGALNKFKSNQINKQTVHMIAQNIEIFTGHIKELIKSLK